MTKLKIGQLTNYCEEPAGNKKFYPVSLLQAIYDARTGIRLDRVLASINSIWLPYAGSFGATMLQVPLKHRRNGLIVTYKDLLGVINTVRYKNIASSINDEQWSNQSNWEGWTFDNAIEDLADALNVIFSDIDSYPTFKQYLNDTLNQLIIEYVDKEEVKQAFANVLTEQIKAIAKEQTENVWHNVTNYQELTDTIREACQDAATNIFDNLDSHTVLRDLILDHVEALMTDKVIEATNELFANLDAYGNVAEVVKAAVDNKIHDVFYNVLNYKDVADIIRSEWQAKLGTLETDDGICELIDTLVHDYMVEVLGEPEKYQKVGIWFSKYVSQAVNQVFNNVTKYAEVVGTIEQDIHDKVKLELDNIKEHTALLDVIAKAVQQEVCDTFKLINDKDGLGYWLGDKIKEGVRDIFNNLNDYPDFKLIFTECIENKLQDVVKNIENYPAIHYLLHQVARASRTKIVSFKSNNTYYVDNFKALVGQAVGSLPVEGVFDDGHSIGDVAIVECKVHDNTNLDNPLNGYLIGTIMKTYDEGEITIFVETAIVNPYDVRIYNLINGLGFNKNGTFSSFTEELIKNCKTSKEVISAIIAEADRINKVIEQQRIDFEEHVKAADEKYLHKDDIGKAGSVPSTGDDNYVHDEFINPKYNNVEYGKYVDEDCFIDDINNDKLRPMPDKIYVDIETALEYYWDGKYKQLNVPIKIGDGHGQAFEGWRGKHLENVALSLPKNIVTDIEQAKRFEGFVQIKYRSRTKTDHQTYSDPFDRAIDLFPATEQLAGVLTPYDKYKLNHFGEFIFDFIKNHPEEVLDAITPRGYQFVVVKVSDIDTHKVTIPDGWDTVKVFDGDKTPSIWEDPDKYARVVLGVDPNATENDIYLNGRETIEVPDGYSPVLVKQH